MADLAKAARRDDSALLFDPTYGAAIKADDLSPAEQPVLFRFLRHRNTVREQQEEKRLLYVAATRARDYLLLATTRATSRAAFAVLEPGLSAAGKEIEPIEYNIRDAEPPAARTTISQVVKPVACLGAISASPKQLPATSLSVYLRCPKQFEFQYVIGHPGLGDGDPLAGRRGTLVHKAIQLGITDEKTLHRFDRSLEASEVAHALRIAEIYRNDGFYARYRTAKADFEVPVVHRIGGLTITGRIDLLGSDFILDFKTGRRSSESEYLLQLWLYAEATGREEVVICYFDGGRPTVQLKTDMAETRDKVYAVLAGIENQVYTPAPNVEKCGWCRYKSICPAAIAVSGE